jgi:hypothetical protein
MEDIVLLFYAHTDYMDIIVPSLRAINKYFKGVKLALCINNKAELLEKYGNEFSFKYLHEFKPGEHVYARISPLLEKIEEPYIIFNIEINVLVDYVDTNILLKILDQAKTQDIDQVKLLVTGVRAPSEIIMEKFKNETANVYLYEVNEGYFLSLNTSLWKRTSLLDLANNFLNHTWRCSECHEIQMYVKTHFKTFGHITRNDRVIIFDQWEHWFNNVFPVVHVMAAGKWRLTGKYQKALIKRVWDEWGLDPNSRESMESENHIF